MYVCCDSYRCILTVQIVLLGLRMCAIWGSRPWTKGVLYIGCLVCTATCITSITIALAHVLPSYQYYPPLQICYTLEPLSSWLWAAFFLPIMVFDRALPHRSVDVGADDVASADISSDHLECRCLAVRTCQEELLNLHDVA
jgi:hypothetical protein